MGLLDKAKDAMENAKRAVNVATGVLDTTADQLHEKALKARKSKLGRKITFALGEDPDADRVIGCEKHELEKEDDSAFMEAFDDFLKETGSQENGGV